jgi:hypothetical protein
MLSRRYCVRKLSEWLKRNQSMVDMTIDDNNSDNMHEKFEETKEVIRIRKSAYGRQYTCHKKRTKR